MRGTFTALAPERMKVPKKSRVREQNVTPHYAQLGGVDGNGKLHAPRHLRHASETHERREVRCTLSQ
jgi:hypothetical protein